MLHEAGKVPEPLPTHPALVWSVGHNTGSGAFILQRLAQELASLLVALHEAVDLLPRVISARAHPAGPGLNVLQSAVQVYSTGTGLQN